MSIIEPAYPRMLPALNDANRAFWTGGAHGRLLVPRCVDCGRLTLPPVAVCPTCGNPVESEAVSGRARVFTWTLNAHQFHPDIPPPNLIAIVELVEQDDLRLTTNLVDCTESDLQIGLEVEVRFEHHGEVFYPVFAPEAK